MEENGKYSNILYYTYLSYQFLFKLFETRIILVVIIKKIPISNISKQTFQKKSKQTVINTYRR